MKLVNKTPHKISVLCADGSVETFEPSGQVARVQSTVSTVHVDVKTGIAFYKATFGEVENLPNWKTGDEIFIVSQMVRERHPEREDLVSPGELVRDNNGVIVACKGFIVNSPQLLWDLASLPLE